MKTYIFGIAHYSNGTTKTSRNYIDGDAFSRWANEQFRKDDGVTIEEYNYQKGVWDYKLVCTWHA